MKENAYIQQYSGSLLLLSEQINALREEEVLELMREIKVVTKVQTIGHDELIDVTSPPEGQ